MRSVGFGGGTDESRQFGVEARSILVKRGMTDALHKWRASLRGSKSSLSCRGSRFWIEFVAILVQAENMHKRDSSLRLCLPHVRRTIGV